MIAYFFVNYLIVMLNMKRRLTWWDITLDNFTLIATFFSNSTWTINAVVTSEGLQTFTFIQKPYTQMMLKTFSEIFKFINHVEMHYVWQLNLTTKNRGIESRMDRYHIHWNLISFPQGVQIILILFTLKLWWY